MRYTPRDLAQGIGAAFLLSAALAATLNTAGWLFWGQPFSLSSLFVGTLPDGWSEFLSCMAGALLLELVLVGWHASALRKLTTASRQDIVLAAVALFGVQSALASVLSGGLTDFAVASLGMAAPQGPLRGAPVWLAVPILFLATTLLGYWGHRLMHTRQLWHLHAIHHAAPAFTLLTLGRVSVLELFGIVLGQAMVFALLGGPPDALYWAGFALGLETFWSHCNIRGVEWLERFGINTPSAHRVHHALDARYHNRNFGDSLCLWDKLFGTYMDSSTVEGELVLGIEDPQGLYGSGRPLRDLFLPQFYWLLCGFRQFCHAGAQLFTSGSRL
jgi:sterol desaturase/sphingolipid hydroxylase (fatty acid hydroxylase superfamily)